MNKRLLFSLCAVVLMLLVPFSSLALQNDPEVVVNHVKSFSSVDEELSSSEKIYVDDSLEEIFAEFEAAASADEKIEVDRIIDSVVLEDGSIDVEAFVEILDEYEMSDCAVPSRMGKDALFGIPSELLANFSAWMIGKLGWTYGGYLMLMNIYGNVLDVFNIVNLYDQYFETLQLAFEEVKSVLDVLFPFHLWDIEMWTALFETNWQLIVSAVIILINVSMQWITFLTGSGQYPDVIQALVDVYTSATDFMTWFNESHWQYPILIQGSVLDDSGDPIVGAEVACRGETALTNETGEFSFMVSSEPTEDDALQSQAWMHNCQITVIYEESSIEMPGWASSAFSDGVLSWWFEWTGEEAVVKTLIAPNQSDSLESISQSMASETCESACVLLMC